MKLPDAEHRGILMENIIFSRCKQRGMNTKTIKDITGHKKDSVFNKYVKISEEFMKLEMDRTWDNIPGHQIKKAPDIKP